MPYRHSSDKTKLMLANSLRELMKKKPLDKIKIHEIVDNCGFNRQTFYYHFHDIYALVEWIYQYDAAGLINEYNDSGDIILIVTKILDYAELHRDEILCVMNSKAQVYFINYVNNGLDHCLKSVIDHYSEDRKLGEKYRSFISGFYTFALSGVLFDWIKSGSSSKMSPQELVRMFEIVIGDNIKRTADRCSEE